MTSIPIISSAIPKKRDTKTAPAYGDANIKKDKAMAKAPAPILNPLDQPGLSLLPSPFTTWEIPANSKPMPNIIITNTAACTGYPTAIEPKMRASTPSEISTRTLHLVQILTIKPTCQESPSE